LALAIGRRSPLLVGWSLTSSCNRACIYCGRKDAGGMELQGDRAVAAAAEMAAAGVIRVSFTGGEPLLHPRLEEIARLLWRRGVQVSLNSNGALLPGALPRLGQYLCGVTISLDGGEPAHDALRGEGSFREVLAGAQAARAHGLPVALHAVLGRANLDQTGALLRVAENLDASIGFTPLEQVPAPAGMDLQPMLPTPKRWRETVDDLIRKKRAGQYRIQNSVAGLRYLRNWPTWQPIRCCAGLVYVRIQPDGSIYGCGNLTGEDLAPSLADTNFTQAFDAVPPGSCRACWCDTRVELNLLLSGSPSALAAAAKR